jgi:hypothetical protein
MKGLIGLALAGAGVMAACGGSTSTLGSGGGSSSVTGTAGGTALATVDQVGLVGTEVSDGQNVAYAGVALTNVAGTCGVLQRHGDPPNAQVLTLVVGTTGTTVTPGTYTVGSTSSSTASVQYDAQDANCVQTTDETASGGTVTLAVVSGSQVEGNFDVTFPGGDHLTGTFTAPVCSVDVFSNTSTSTCGS